MKPISVNDKPASVPLVSNASVEALPLPSHSAQQSSLGTLPTWLARGNYAWIALGGMLAAVAIFTLATLMRFPAPFVDEPWNASRSWALIHTGRAFGTLDAGVFEKYDGYWTFFPWLASAVHAPFVALFGPNLFSVRFASLLAGLALLAVVYIIASRLYGARTGLLAVLLVALSLPFVYSSRMGRHDIVAALLGYGAVALYLTDRAPPSTLSLKSVLSGLAVGLTLDVHMNGVIFGPALLAFYLSDNGWSVLRKARFWGFVVGVCGGIAFYLAMHILPYPQTYFTLASLGNGTSRTPPLLTLDPGIWLLSLRDTLLLLGVPTGMLVVAAMLILWRRRSASDVKSLILFVVLTLTFAAIIQGKPLWYGILISPAASLLVAALLGRLSSEKWRGSLRTMRLATVRLVVVLGLVGASIAISLRPMLKDAKRDYQTTLNGVRAAVSPGASVIGSQTWWFAVSEQPYLSWDQLVYYNRHAPGSTLEDAFRAFRPDYFVVDDWVDIFIAEGTLSTTPQLQRPSLPRAELEEFLGKQARLVTEVKTPTFGSVRIYRINWD